MQKRLYLTLIFLLGIHLFILSRLQFTAWPEMVSFPYLLNHGFINYKDMIHAYPPFLINILAVLYKIFGYSALVLKIFGWAGFLVNDILIFLILKKLINKQSFVLTGVFVYTVLQPILDGNMVWPDLFIIPFLLFSFLLLLNKKFFIAGIAIGFAVLTKQTGLLFLGISGVWLLIYEHKKFKNIFNYIFGILVILISFLITLIKQNSLNDFINWTIIYPGKYWTKFPGYVQLLPTLRENIILLILFLPVAVLLISAVRQKKQDKEFYLLLGFLAIGIIGVYPRFSFFHLQSAIAFLIITYFYLLKNFKKRFLYLVILIPTLVLILNFRNLQFGDSRFWADSDIKLGEIIKNETPENRPIYLLGLPSQLYTFSERFPNKPWSDNFGWYLEIPDIQKSVVNSFEQNPPSVIFWQTPETGNWYDIGVYQPKLITNYIINNYTKLKEIQKGIWEWKKK